AAGAVELPHISQISQEFCTGELRWAQVIRWVQVSDMVGAPGEGRFVEVLQQRWVLKGSNSIRDEWRDVPTVRVPQGDTA
ncbi:MAG: hypothetical protein AB7F35_29710, partial [Acetobacteraceae bacterium]